MPSNPLRLEAIAFHTDDGHAADPRELIIPICWHERATGRARTLGTCFPFFSKQNIFLTAKHLFTDEGITITDSAGGRFSCSSGRELVGIHYYYLDGYAGVPWLPRPITRLWMHPTADIAMGLFAGIKFLKVPHTLVDKIPSRDFGIPSKDDLLATFAYPELRGQTLVEIARQTYEVKTARAGYVNIVYPQGRDRVLLPGPCMETSIDIRGGMSGGPVFNSLGRVCGVNSTSLDVDSGVPPVSFVSLLGPVLDMRLPDTGRNLSFTVRELLDLGF